jgi:hypothetical protein
MTVRLIDAIEASAHFERRAPQIERRVAIEEVRRPELERRALAR